MLIFLKGPSTQIKGNLPKSNYGSEYESPEYSIFEYFGPLGFVDAREIRLPSAGWAEPGLTVGKDAHFSSQTP